MDWGGSEKWLGSCMLVSRTTEKARISTIIKGEDSAHEVTK